MKYIAFLLLLVWEAPAAFSQDVSIIQMEYWLDADPGFGKATPINGFTAAKDVADVPMQLPSGTSAGLHVVGIRSKDARGVWSHTRTLAVFSNDTTATTVADLEYFWDEDPGVGEGRRHTLDHPRGDIADLVFEAELPPGIALGGHALFARTKDDRGRWSHTAKVAQVEVVGPLGINGLTAQSHVSIYPNPVADALTVANKGGEKIRIVVHDAKGQAMLDKVVDTETSIDTQSWAPGAYAVLFIEDGSRIYAGTIVKK